MNFAIYYQGTRSDKCIYMLWCRMIFKKVCGCLVCMFAHGSHVCLLHSEARREIPWSYRQWPTLEDWELNSGSEPTRQLPLMKKEEREEGSVRCCACFWEDSTGTLKSRRVGSVDSAFYAACSFNFCLCIGVQSCACVCTCLHLHNISCVYF